MNFSSERGTDPPPLLRVASVAGTHTGMNWKSDPASPVSEEPLPKSFLATCSQPPRRWGNYISGWCLRQLRWRKEYEVPNQALPKRSLRKDLHTVPQFSRRVMFFPMPLLLFLNFPGKQVQCLTAGSLYLAQRFTSG